MAIRAIFAAERQPAGTRLTSLLVKKAVLTMLRRAAAARHTRDSPAAECAVRSRPRPHCSQVGKGEGGIASQSAFGFTGILGDPDAYRASEAASDVFGERVPSNCRSGRRGGTFRALQLQHLATFRSLAGDSERACRAMQVGGGSSSRRGAVRELLLRGFLFGLLRWQFASQPSAAAEKLGDDEFAIDFDEGPRESACVLACLVLLHLQRNLAPSLTHNPAHLPPALSIPLSLPLSFSRSPFCHVASAVGLDLIEVRFPAGVPAEKQSSRVIVDAIKPGSQAETLGKKFRLRPQILLVSVNGQNIEGVFVWAVWCVRACARREELDSCDARTHHRASLLDS